MAIAAIAVVAIAIAVAFQVRQVRRLRRVRRAAVLPAGEVLDDAVLAQDSIGYPVCRGAFRGDRVTVELVVDTMTIRRLPRLWLVATLRRPTGLPCAVDVLRDPLPTDIVAPGLRYPYEHTRPARWPEFLRVASADPVLLPDLDDVDLLTTFLGHEKSKDILLAPGGVRVVVELARGEKGLYRVLRRPDFRARIDPGALRALLEHARKIADDVSALPARDTPAVMAS